MTHSTPGCLGLQSIAGSEAPSLHRTGWGDPSERGPTGGFPTFNPVRPGLRNRHPFFFVPCRALTIQLEDYLMTVCLSQDADEETAARME